MIVTDWQATPRLRWSKETGMLQQQWARETSEIRKYNGRDYWCKGFEHEWRDVPTESSQDNGVPAHCGAGGNADAQQVGAPSSNDSGDDYG